MQIDEYIAASNVRMTGKQPNGKNIEANDHDLTVSSGFDVTFIKAFV